MTAEELVMATRLQITNTGNPGTSAAARKQSAPAAKTPEAALLGRQPAPVAADTTSGDTKSPRLPAPATAALEIAPALNCLTAIVRRNVVPAVSRIPALSARQSS